MRSSYSFPDEPRMFGEEPAYKNRQHDICQARSEMSEVNKVIDLNEVRITPCGQQALKSLVQGCSNKEIAGQSKISPRTVKQPWRRLFPPRRYLGMAASESTRHAVFTPEQARS
jgi:FixJ family two-component response regulator